MNILIVGSGGREHTLGWKLNQSDRVKRLYFAPGNAGTAGLGENIPVKADDLDGLLAFAKQNAIDLTVVGPEVPLCLGIADRFKAEGLKVFGPDAACARLEGSKAFSKDFMVRHNIPTAGYREFTDPVLALEQVGAFGYPAVVKADGLAAGKGVLIAEDEAGAKAAVRTIMEERSFGASGDKIVLEEFLTGIEASILCFVDGDTLVPMVSAQDYKKIFDDDKGPNTGGMGTYSPSVVYKGEIRRQTEEKVLKPFLEGLKKDGLDFRGVIFIGLMISEAGEVKVLEFNVRFGDPETQSIIPRMKTDLLEVLEACVEGRLSEVAIEWKEEAAVCVVLASGGYPGPYEKGKEITGLDAASESIVLHAGTRLSDGKVLTNGGRVLGVVSLGATVAQARAKSYETVKGISFEGMQYRTDIGKIASE